MKRHHVRPKEQIAAQIKSNSRSGKRVITKARARARHTDIGLLSQYIPAARRVLCVGARDDSEVRAFIDAGYVAEGVDVAYESTHITQLDAHDLAIIDDDAFDVVYCSHCLEHMHDAHKVLSNLRRITSQALFIVLPMGDKRTSIHHATLFDIMRAPEDLVTLRAAATSSDFRQLAPCVLRTCGYRKNVASDRGRREVFLLFALNK